MMNVTLQSVQFRIPGADNGAFNISLSDTDHLQRRLVTGPEWQRDVPTQPAAFAPRDTAPFIDVVLRSSDAATFDARLQATAVGGHVLGDVPATEIRFQDGQWSGRIRLTAAHIAAVSHSTLRWHWQISAGEERSQFDSEHEIYTVLSTPTDPWEAFEDDPSAAPWQEALDAACEWTNGAATDEEVLTAICQEHYRSGRFKYGSDSYTEEGIFKIGKFFAQQAMPGVNQVDCSDCATIVYVFARLLGVVCFNLELDTVPETDFSCVSSNIFVGGELGAGPGFNQHEAVSGSEEIEAARIWDFCLGHRIKDVPKPYTNIPFSNPQQPQNTYPVEAFIPVAPSCIKKVRTFNRQIKDTARIIDLSKSIDQSRFEFNSWKKSFHDFKGLAFLDFVPQLIQDVLPVESYRYRTQPKPWLVDNVYQFEGETIQISLFECESREDAHLALLHLLSDLRAKPILKLQIDHIIGDVLFYDDDGQADRLLFGRGNLAVRIQRDRGSHRSLLEYAQLIDSLLTSGLATLRDSLDATNNIIRHVLPNAGSSFSRFFSTAAEVIVSGVNAKLRNGPRH